MTRQRPGHRRRKSTSTPTDGCMVRSVGDRAPAGEPQAPATTQEVAEAFRELFGEPSPYPPPYGRSPGDISDR